MVAQVATGPPGPRLSNKRQKHSFTNPKSTKNKYSQTLFHQKYIHNQCNDIIPHNNYPQDTSIRYLSKQ